MAFTPTAGEVAIMVVGSTEIPIINWSAPIDGKLKDVSNCRDGRRKVDTLHDATVSATLVWDGDDQPTDTDAANLRPGVEVTIKCYTDATKFFSAPFTIATIGPKNEGVEGVVMMDFTAGLNGAVTYPL